MSGIKLTRDAIDFLQRNKRGKQNKRQSHEILANNERGRKFGRNNGQIKITCVNLLKVERIREKQMNGRLIFLVW